MSTKAEAARANGAKSSGPITEQGKAQSAQNSLKHGLNSTRVVLPHESQEEYDALEAAILNRFNPADEFEMELAKEMAAARWRLRRIEAMEAALFRKAMRDQQELLGPEADPNYVRDAAYLEVAESKTMRTLVRNQSQLRRAYEKAWRELESLQQARGEQTQQNEPSAAKLTSKFIDLVFNAPMPHIPGVDPRFAMQNQAGRSLHA